MGGDERQLLRCIIQVLSTPDLEYPQRIKGLLQALTTLLPIRDATLFLNPLGQGLSPLVLHANSPVFFEPDNAGVPRNAGWHPLDNGGTLTLPIEGKGVDIGYLSLLGLERSTLPPWCHEDLELICKQIAWLTTCNHQMQKNLQQKEHLQLLARASQRINQAHTVHEMLSELLSSLVRENKAIFTIVRHNDNQSDRYKPIFELASGFRSLRSSLLELSASMHQEVTANGRPVLNENLSHCELKNLSLPFTALALPLVFHDKVLGTLTLVCAKNYSQNPLISEEKNRQLFYDLSVQVAEAWGRLSGLRRLAAISKENQRKLRELSFLHFVSNAMHGMHGLDDLVHFILSAAVLPDGADCDRAMLFMINERSGFLQGMLGVTRESSFEGWAPDFMNREPFAELIPQALQQAQRIAPFNRLVQQQRIPLDEEYSSVAIAARRCKVLLQKVSEGSTDPLAEALDLGPFICVPLQGRKSVLAVLVADNHRSGRSFDLDETRFLKLFANQAGAAMENAMLLQQLRNTHTELRAAQENLLQTEKLATIGEIAASVAHELKNPLVCVGGFANRLLKNVPEGSRSYEYAEIIAREVRRVEEMLTNILSFSKRQLLCFAECNVIQVIGSALNLVSRELTESGIEIIQHIDPDLPPVIGDERQLRQVLINLFGNAREVMEEGGKLTVEARRSTLRGDPAIAIEVSDTGGGIPPESLRNIFNPFFTTKSSGTGLGLSISHRIIEHHHGAIEVFNHDRGATFIIQLPTGRKKYSES